uniref:Uncharacterized protein n=1 Tax=Echeneis naucrates TaxID=173247 RepID=A0A665U8W0_ECHNA
MFSSNTLICNHPQNEQNKMPADSKASKHMSEPHLSKQKSENTHPGISEMGRKPPVRPGMSRLPVLAKTLHLQTPSNFSQSHCRWEEKPLAGKAKKKRPCTRPVPFNLSQPKGSRATNENQKPQNGLQSQTGTDSVQSDNIVCNARLKAQNINSKPYKHQAVSNDDLDSTYKSHPKPTYMSHLLGRSGPTNTLRTSTAFFLTCHSSLVCLCKYFLIFFFFLGGCISDKGENFQSDHAALLSILQNEGVSTAGLQSATPQSKPYNYLVRWLDVKLVQFSPDHAALQSILQNEGVRAGGPVGATPRKSVCPSGRGTSVYTAQRVPVRKNHAEAPSGPAAVFSSAVALRETPLRKWTPQRVRDTRHQSRYTNTRGLTSSSKCKKSKALPINRSILNEFLMWLYFDLFPPSLLQTKSCSEEKEEKEETKRGDLRGDEEEEQSLTAKPPFFQAPQRESVIFFSTGKKLFRAPRFQKQESSSQDQHDPVSSEQRTKSCSLSPAVALLRKRLPPLEELRMDEEVATYTSVPVPAASGSLPCWPRCGNPLATILHFEESSRFVPIGFDSPSGPSSPHCSPLQER